MMKIIKLQLIYVTVMICTNFMSGEEPAYDPMKIFGHSTPESENANPSSGSAFRVVDETENQGLYAGFSLADADKERIQAIVENCRQNYKDPVLVCCLFFQEEGQLHRTIFSIESDQGKIRLPKEMTFHIEKYLDVEIEHLEVYEESQSLIKLEVQLSVFYSSRLFDKVDRLIHVVPNTFLPVVDMSRTGISNNGEKLELQSYILFYLVMP